MRTIIALVASLAAMLALATQKRSVEVTLRVVDADAGTSVPAVIRMLDGQGNPLPLEGLLSRGEGLGEESPLRPWYVALGPLTLSLPRERIQVEAFSGVETLLTRVEFDLSDGSSELTVPLKRFSRVADQGWRSANTHLHLMKLRRRTADRYLIEVPAADDLDVLFVSYLERAGDDVDYISNEYPVGDLKQFSRGAVLVSNGEEHRHNFGSHGEGYGHVMLLGIRELVQPVSIGPGISKRGSDGTPIAAGIDTAHQQGGFGIWCHNDWGMEDVPNWITGRLDAQNIFDGSPHNSFAESFYRYLNVGLKVPFSTGTDWFMYDISRVYARTGGSLTSRAWLEALVEGRSFITNGPLLEFSVEGRQLGETIELSDPRSVRIEGRAVSRIDFGRLELVFNGRVIREATSREVDGHFEAAIDDLVSLAGPGWLALRTPPPPYPLGGTGSSSASAGQDTGGQAARATHPTNEFGRRLFAHTSPVYVTMRGRSVFIPEQARRLLADMQSARRTILAKATFASRQEQQRILAIYDEAITHLRRQIAQAH